MFDKIFIPFKIGNVEIKNRIVMPGMGNAKGTWDGYGTDALDAWYVARAKGGTGLIITEITAIEPHAPQGIWEAAIYDDSYIPGYVKMVNEVHAAGAKIFLQLHHAGRESDEDITDEEVLAVSKIPCPLHRQINREMTTEEVWEIIEAYGDAAERGKRAGFDGIEVHGGHGYLPAQFMSMHTNKRTDEFGGDMASRAKFGIEMVKNIKAKCGVDYPVMLRFSGDELVADGRRVRETIMYLKMMIREAGLDAVNITVGTYGVMHSIIAPSQLDIMYVMDSVEKVKKALTPFGVPVLGVGRINDPTVAEMLIEDGVLDAVCCGRALIADPEFVNKTKEGRLDEICPCIGCMTRCQGLPGSPLSPGGISCACNPLSGWELTYKVEKVANHKNLVVVGGGPGGLYAAMLAAKCGHKVTLFEKDEKLGGQALIACMPPHKSEIARLVKHYVTMCKKYGVELRTGVQATADDVLALKPDAVILATGSKPVVPNLENDGIAVVKAVDILKGDIMCGENVLVVGGGLVGLETAEYVAMQNRRATVVEMQAQAGADVHFSIQYHVLKSLRGSDIPVLTNTKVVRFTVDGAVCEGPDGEFVLKGFDQVAMAVGSKSYNPLEEALTGKVAYLKAIGDAIDVGKIAQTTDYAMHAVLNLNATC